MVYEAGQVNPQGQAVYKEGDIKVVAGLNLTLYKDKTGFINNATVGGLAIFDYIANGSMGPANSLWASSNPAQGDANLYHILAVDGSVSFAQYWTLTDTFFMFDGANTSGAAASPAAAATPPVVPGTGTGFGGCEIHTGIASGLALGCLNLPAWYWNELKLSLNDGAITHWPISFNPYITWYLELYPSGPTGILGTTTSAACFSCNLQGTDFIIGMTPKVNMQPYIGIPVTLSAPTWVTVGPQSFWAGNSGSGPGSGCVLANCSNGSLGVFSTGLTASLAMTWIPAQYGHWNLKAGFQWYDIINTALQQDNVITYGGSLTNLQSSIFTGFVGVGVGF